ncbi:MAG TPA: rod shape-determining protein MreC [Acidobacteriaceae bacterium]|nr:rod shape-determining protein MreC [Acidobacteriaceae bacterium]
MDFITRFKNAMFLIVVLLAQAIALAMQVRTPADASKPDGPSVRLIRMWATATVTPFERLAHAVGWGIHNGWSNYLDLRHVRQQNKDLQQQLTRMRIDQAAIAEDALEGRRLQAMLAFKEKYVGTTVAAQVIGDSGSDQTHVLTIDKGSRDGLRPDMAVITQDGIVGKLRDVFPNTAQVLEINDQTSGAGVILATTRIRGILRGTVAGRAQIGNLTADSRIKPGEQVLTSGGDKVYPRGLPVGTIQSIAPDPDHQPYSAIVVRPAVNLDRLEEVLVITGTQSDLPAGTQQDLTAAEAQHAADVSAEKLPGLHDDDPAAGTANPVGPNTSTTPATPPVTAIPRPPPPVHPDRYTSGTTPPALELTPGGRNSAPATAKQDETPAAKRPTSQAAPPD